MPTAKYITQRRKIQPIFYLFILVFPCSTGIILGIMGKQVKNDAGHFRKQNAHAHMVSVMKASEA
jgi:hypothetical protein